MLAGDAPEGNLQVAFIRAADGQAGAGDGEILAPAAVLEHNEFCVHKGMLHDCTIRVLGVKTICAAPKGDV
jgi:hypothetical protein